MKVSIFGLGYVGCVSAVCLAQDGHTVIGLDTNRRKTELIKQAIPTVNEPGLHESMRQNIDRISVTDDTHYAIVNSDVSMIAVGTPLNGDALDMTQVNNVVDDIALALANKTRYHLVVIRSTVPPGTNDRVRDHIAKKSGKVIGQEFDVISNPEFLREGSAVKDYYNPPYTIIGTSTPITASLIQPLYSKVSGDVYVVAPKTAEMLKYTCNTFHALKITFANEIGAICKHLGVDSHNVMELLTKDTKLNISPTYLKPGFAYGGSCLPKDVKALSSLSPRPLMISAISSSNAEQIIRTVDKINAPNKHVSIVGIGFKPGTDDLRESPVLKLVTLLRKDHHIKLYDPLITHDALDTHPEIAVLFTTDVKEVINTETLIVTSPNITLPTIPKNVQVLDLCTGGHPVLKQHPNYDGINW